MQVRAQGVPWHTPAPAPARSPRQVWSLRVFPLALELFDSPAPLHQVPRRPGQEG